MRTENSKRTVAVAACLMAALASLAACGRSDGTASNRLRPTNQEDLDRDRVLAKIPSVATVAAGTTVGIEPTDVEVTPVTAPEPTSAGALSLADGVAVAIRGGKFDGAFQVTLSLPPDPGGDAVPGVLHVGEDGKMRIEPGTWDPAAGTITVEAAQFSERFGGWWNPLNWAEAGINGVAGAVDATADWLTGRTDPPACKNDVSWASKKVNELSSVHVCLQMNLAEDGSERAEVYIKSNRNTAQLITVPSGVDYLWVEYQQPAIQRLLARAAGGDSNMVLLPGGSSMSFGFRRPIPDLDYEVLSLTTKRMVVINGVMSYFGSTETDVTIAVAAAAYSCASGYTGFDPTHLDAVPDGFDSADGFYQATLSCLLDIGRSPDLAVSTLDEVLRRAGESVADRNEFLGRVHTALEHAAPTLAKLAASAALTQVSAGAWDNIFDTIADGRLSVHLNGTGQQNSPTTSQQSTDDGSTTVGEGCPMDRLTELGVGNGSTRGQDPYMLSLVDVACTSTWALVTYANIGIPDMTSETAVDLSTGEIYYLGGGYFTPRGVLSCIGMDDQSIGILGQVFMQTAAECDDEAITAHAMTPCTTNRNSAEWLELLSEAPPNLAVGADNAQLLDGADAALAGFCNGEQLLGYMVAYYMADASGTFRNQFHAWFPTLEAVCASEDGFRFRTCNRLAG